MRRIVEQCHLDVPYPSTTTPSVCLKFTHVCRTFGEDVADSYATTEDYEDGFIITENYTEDVNQNVTDSSGRPVETTHTFDYEDDNQGLVEEYLRALSNDTNFGDMETLVQLETKMDV
ncbi:hypothetical protein NECAME_16393 [Necator americanus]|uniref:Uncharacterized protein n=1 Tax=Necator americanus TaxID=51031 RepID=W2TW94_NECAM|nr:hypothetical protein NECAME_16393 [Necator americanus]ETN86340.1 hypothetical protein NECAME_16393 [Necator americanus]